MKYIISFIIGIFIIALLIRSCDNDNYIYDDNNIAEFDENSTDFSVKDNEETEAIIIDTRDLEIPRLQISKPEQILYRAGYITSYNSSTKNANWVAWKLTKEHTDGPYKRNGIPYIEDDEIIGARQELADWNSVSADIDHGHLCPAGDNKWSQDAMTQSFLLSNMSPQNRSLNTGIWERLESRTRGWAKHYGEAFVVTGPIFYSDNYATIGNNEVGIPDAFYKVILVLGKKPKAIGFIMPNQRPEFKKIDFYAIPVDSVENVTGIDFFYKLPDDIEDIIESVADFSKW